MRIPTNIFFNCHLFMERQYSPLEIQQYVHDKLNKPWDRPKLEHYGGKWKFSKQKMEEYCKEHRIGVYPNPENPDFDVVNLKDPMKENPGYQRLIRVLYKTAPL